MDVLSEVLRAVQLDGAMFFNAEFSAPWLLVSPAARSLKQYLAPGAEHLIIYHLVTDGHAYAQLDGEHNVLLEAGDIIVFPHGNQHKMGNGYTTQIIDGGSAFSMISSLGMKVMKLGGGGDVTRFVCGYMSCNADLCKQLLECLPPVLKVNVRSDASGRWLENSIRNSVLQAGSDSAGSGAVLAKLSEVLFIEVLRRYVESLPEGHDGWLGGTRDPVVGRALSLMHSRPADDWSVAKLAQEAGVSRSVLAERFTHYTGEPPMSYLTRWRMRLGAQLLNSSSRSVLDIASEVGYQSEAAFNRAFRREFGLPPARYRSQNRSKAGSTA
jgi:AraC-like DNA-binding protein